MRKSTYELNYKPTLSLFETQKAIKFVKDAFQNDFAESLSLSRVTAPLFVIPTTGLNDNLNGIERPVSFDIPSANENAEIVQSLAKWKRMALGKYEFKHDTGLYTDMNAIRRDEDLDFIHSCYVDQWDWEKVITAEERTLDYLKEVVNRIFEVMKGVERKVYAKYPQFKPVLPETIAFVSTSELEKRWPNKTRKEREDLIAEEKKAVFVYQIGWPLKDNQSHDGRAADYDDWNLNGDILVWFDMYNMALELSSMGIRVDEESLPKQLKYKNEEYKLNNEFCKGIMNKELPLSIGGGIGQSRLCMFFLRKAHIGEVQSSFWSEKDHKFCEEKGINIL